MSLYNLYQKFHHQVQFLSIYIREAHPVDGWWFGKGITRRIMKIYSPKVAMDVYNPTSNAERRAVAGDCQDALKYGISTYVDEIDDPVNQAYAAWPTRLYLVGLDGKVVYHGGLGPYDFHPSKLGRAIEHYLAQTELSAQEK